MSTPWLKFYPSDWRADPALRMCSVGARGLWMEMLCVMHEASPRGSLRVNGNALSERQLASLSGAAVDEVCGLLAELEASGVFSRDDDGVIFSRRMMRDDAKAQEDKANGKLGGNPTLKGGVNPPKKGEDKAQKPEAIYHKEGVGANAPTSPEPDKSAPVAFELPCASGEMFPIYATDIAEWATAFPAVDVRQQLSAARSWLIANPTRAKTKRGMRKFIVSWMDRRQNAAGQPAPKSTSPPRANGRRNYVDAAQDRLSGNGSEGIFGDHGDVELISAGKREPGFDAPDIRSGLGRRIVPGSH